MVPPLCQGGLPHLTFFLPSRLGSKPGRLAYCQQGVWQFAQYRRQEEQSPEVVPTPKVEA
jgi:hypothetical protein